MVHPVGQSLRHFGDGSPFEVGVLFVAVARRVLLLLILVLLPELVEAMGADLGTRRDPGDLSAEIVGLVAGEGRVAADRGVQPAGEEFADMASGGDLSRGHRGQLDPGKAGLRAHIVHILVDPRAIDLSWYYRRGFVGRLW